MTIRQELTNEANHWQEPYRGGKQYDTFIVRLPDGQELETSYWEKARAYYRAALCRASQLSFNCEQPAVIGLLN